MSDRYADFSALARVLIEDVDYVVHADRRNSTLAIVAPHGGGIEPGTSELAAAIARERHSFYAFEGVRSKGNGELHVTSTRFDEPRLLEVVTAAQTVIALHGEAGDREAVYVGGLDVALGQRLTASLIAAGFSATPHDDARLHGTDPANLCNRGSSGAGVQLEISRATRRTLFASLDRAGRRQRTARFNAMVTAIVSVLG
jgi:phage replication-related protein YjqB (UPF0714/DUF867 family)